MAYSCQQNTSGLLLNINKSLMACRKCFTYSVWRCKSYILLSWAYNLQNSTANGMQGPVPEEMSQARLTNNKQGNAAIIISQTSFAITRRNMFILMENRRSP